MAKKDVSSIEKGAGYFLGFITALMNVARQKFVPFEAIYRLGTEGGYATVVKIVDLAHTDWLAEQPKPVEAQPQGGHPSYRDASTTNVNTLPKNHYRVRLTYAPMPSLAELRKEFGKNNVSDIFDGREWELHSSCVGMDRTPGEKVFYVHEVGRNWEREEQIAWGLKQRNPAAPNGYRPATHDEEYEFSKAHPELVDYVGLGDSALDGDRRFVASVWQGDGQRVLDDYWLDYGFSSGYRVLFVSK